MYFLVFLRLSTKSSKNLEKTKKNKPMGWRRSGGLGCVFLFFFLFFLFFCFFFVFLRLSTKSSKNLEKTKKNKKNKPMGWRRSGGLGCFFFCFFWFWKTLADIVRRKGADGVRLSVSV